MTKKSVKGFSKLSKEAKIEWIANEYLDGDEECVGLLKSYWHNDAKVQKIHDEFIENTISNFYVPFGIAPNFLINDEIFCVPMAIEESSVVAAAAKNATFWMNRGGFKAEVISTTKVGHVHFAWYGEYETLVSFFESIKHKFIEQTNDLTENMRRRGGGILDIQLVNKTDDEPNYYQLMAKFETCEAMGANFINSILEEFSKILQAEIENSDLPEADKKVMVIMCILSNYTPECLVRAEVTCPIESLTEGTDLSPEEFAKKFEQAIHVAKIEPYRATTHNKGIFNGIDAVVIATGNDFRAIESAAHAYASKSGSYKSLTKASVENKIFKFSIEIPLALGTVGGLTKLHPLANLALDILGKPNSEDLMKITAVAGLAQNFAAIKSLITTGIQHGHMKMHLINILNQQKATDKEKEKAIEYFKTNTVSHLKVDLFIKKLRSNG